MGHRKAMRPCETDSVSIFKVLALHSPVGEVKIVIRLDPGFLLCDHTHFTGFQIFSRLLQWRKLQKLGARVTESETKTAPVSTR